MLECQLEEMANEVQSLGGYCQYDNCAIPIVRRPYKHQEEERIYGTEYPKIECLPFP